MQVKKHLKGNMQEKVADQVCVMSERKASKHSCEEGEHSCHAKTEAFMC